MTRQSNSGDARTAQVSAKAVVMDVRHFPSGLPYRQVGDTRIIAKTNAMADRLAGMFETFDQGLEEKPVTSCDEFLDECCEIQQRLERIERILRNGLPHDDKNVEHTIGHAHAETELVLEAIKTDWWRQ